jgi:hypothetical protein
VLCRRLGFRRGRRWSRCLHWGKGGVSQGAKMGSGGGDGEEERKVDGKGVVGEGKGKDEEGKRKREKEMGRERGKYMSS